MSTGPHARFVDLADAEPDEAVVVVDVLRAFTTVPWLLDRGAVRVLAVATAQEAFELRRRRLPDALLVGEDGGERIEGFDLGNSPADARERDLTGREVLLRTSAGTQGLARCAGSGLLLAASFVVAGATARLLAAADVGRVTFVITGASLGRDGDEDLACAQLIAARAAGRDPEPTPYLARVAGSDAGRRFGAGGPAWASPQDLDLACELDRFEHALQVGAATDLEALEVRAAPA